MVNCAGPFSDFVRKEVSHSDLDRVVPGKGSHMVLPREYATEGLGLLIPKTLDGRILFVLPWEDHTLVGTTDSKGLG